MESLTKGLRWRNSPPKPLQITERSSANIITNKDHIGVDHEYYDVGEEEPLSPTARLFHEPNFCAYVIAIMGFRNPINPSVMYDKLPHTLLKHPRFSSLQVVDDKNGGKMKWVPTNVSLNNHIIVPNIPQTLEGSYDKFVEDYVSNLSKTSIDSSKPMWDFHLLKLKTSNAEGIGIFRIHHSLGDGTSLISVLLACTRQISNPDAVPTVPTSKNSNSGWLSSYKFDRGGPWWQRWFMAACMIFWLIWNTLVDIGYGMATLLFLNDTETLIKAPNGVELNPKRLVYLTVSLDDIKFIKNAMNLTINDVAMGVIQAGLSQYLNRRYGEGKRDEGATEKKNNLPKKKIRMRSTVPVNIRPSLGIQAMTDMMEKNTRVKLGNKIALVILPFTIGIRDDPLDYLREAKSIVDRKKHSLEAIYSFSAINLVFKLFGIKAAKTIACKGIARTTFAFSNVVGPQEEIGFFGHDIEFIAPSLFGIPWGLVIHFQSYVNKMTIVLSVDENTIPDPHRLLDDFEASLKLIKEAVYAKGLVKKGKA